jgi:hypothetical protein
MNAADMRAFEAHLLEIFPHASSSPTGPRRTDGPPEWLMTGTWVTVPPARAAQLSDEARSFTNEFVPDREEAVAHTRDDDRGSARSRGDDVR